MNKDTLLSCSQDHMNKYTLLSCFSRERVCDYERDGGRGGRRRGSEMAEEDVKRVREDDYLFSY